LSKAKVLLLDDDPMILMALAEFLQLEGYSTVHAANLKSGYAAVEAHTPDLAIIDFDLPDGDALEFLAGLKRMNAGMKCIRAHRARQHRFSGEGHQRRRRAVFDQAGHVPPRSFPRCGTACRTNRTTVASCAQDGPSAL